MIRNYLKIAIRNLLKHRVISFINLFGLTIGLTCSLLILSYILNELSFDRYNVNANRIYRVTRNFNNQDGTVSLRLSTIAPPFGPYLINDFPEIEKMTRLFDNGITPVRYQEKLFNEENVYFADEHFFEVFTHQTIAGNPRTALTEPYSIMLTEEMATKYFGEEEPINKILRLNNQINLKVTGVFKNFPSNSHMHPSMLISFNTLKDTAVYGEQNLRTSWGNNAFFTYLLLPENYPVKRMLDRFPSFVDKHVNRKDYNGQDPSKFTFLGLQKLTDIHLYSHTDYEAEPNGDIKRVYIFSLIAFFVLLIACINYMNLSTARSALRAREIGIRKVIGAARKELIFQFLGESVLVCWAALLMALILTRLTLPWLNRLTGQTFYFSGLLSRGVLAPLFLTPFVIGGLSGIYPALYMSSFQPIKTLKGLFRANGGISFRKALVTTQFAIGIALMITTAIVFQQLHFMQNKSLGFDKEKMVILNCNQDLSKQYASFRTELLRNSAFGNLTCSSRIPSGRLLDDMGAFVFQGDSMRPLNTDIKFISTDYDFAPTYGLKILAGRNFSRDFGTDTSGFVLNESAVKVIGWKTAGEAVGKDFKYGNRKGHVIGVVNDFHFESMRQQIAPMVFVMFPPRLAYYSKVSVKISGNDLQSAIAYLENTWKKLLPETPFQFNFLDERFDKLYQAEQKQGNLLILFACIAILIACLGLFGLSSFAISQRVKEIGVRKVLGAKLGSIVSLLSKEFLILVLVAACIAFPVAWFAMHQWLKDFAYRIRMEWWVFLAAGLLAALIALFTVAFQAIKAAMANPVRSLRTE